MPVGRHSLPLQPLTTEMNTYTTRQQVAIEEQRKLEKAVAKLNEATLNAFDEGTQAVQFIMDLAVQNGMSANRPTLFNAQSFIESDYQSAKERLKAYEQLATEAGYCSIPKAIEGLRKRTTRHDELVAQLPLVYQKTPIRLALNKSNLELGRIERTIRRTQRELLDAFDAGMSDDIQEEMAEAWADLETLADLEGFYTELIKFNNNYEEPAASETVPTSEMLTRFELASKFSEAFLSDLTEMVQSAPVEVERKESIYRNNANPNNLVEFVLWQHLARDMEELLFLRHMSEFATYLEDRGLAVPHGKTLESGLTASAEHRYDWEWAECVCLNDLLNYFADNGIELNLPQTTVVETEALEETEEELLSCL